MLSRVANAIYWLARYVERAEYCARVLDVNSQLVLDASGVADFDPVGSWLPTVSVSGDAELFKARYSQIDERNAATFMLFDRENPNSVRSCINQARENARTVREQISSEMWEQINRLYLRLRDQGFEDYQRIGPNEYLGRAKASIQLLFGIAESLMPRREGWHFFNLGRFLERADNVSRLIDAKYYAILPEDYPPGSAMDLIQWAAVLRSCSAFEAFRKNRHGRITGSRVVEYLILDAFFPQSVYFSVSTAESALRDISGDSEHRFSNPAVRAMGKLRADLDYVVIEDIIGRGLHEYIDELQERIADISGKIDQTFISYPISAAKALDY